ncbi:MAG: hypothetical protein EOM03_08025 [Clostridia bacterium]|nr:MSCRAMM family adhesin SdrC [Verrucomicrobiota bacterium]NCC84059.1 hypothetical protein [Clostridia bacterium]
MVLPAAGYVLALGALAVLAAPAISKIQKLWNADKLPVVEEQTPARPSSRTLVARSADSWSSATPSILSETSNSGISLPKPAEEEEPQEEYDGGNSALAQQGYMPLLGGQSRSGGERQLTKAERKRLQEKKEREDAWAYGSTEDIMKMAEEDALKSNNSSLDSEDYEEETMESIVLKDRKTLLLYRAMKGDSASSSFDKDSSRMADGRTDSDSSGQRGDNPSASKSNSDEKAYADSENDSQTYQEKSPFDSKTSSLSFADKPLYTGNNLLNPDNPLFSANSSDWSGSSSRFPVMPQSRTSPGADSLISSKSGDQRINDFRAMISSSTGSRAPIGGLPNNRAIISGSGGGIPGLNPTAAGVSTPGRITLPGSSQPNGIFSGALSAPAPARSLLPENPTRGAAQEGSSSRAIPRLIIRR